MANKTIRGQLRTFYINEKAHLSEESKSLIEKLLQTDNKLLYDFREKIFDCLHQEYIKVIMAAIQHFNEFPEEDFQDYLEDFGLEISNWESALETAGYIASEEDEEPNIEAIRYADEMKREFNDMLENDPIFAYERAEEFKKEKLEDERASIISKYLDSKLPKLIDKVSSKLETTGQIIAFFISTY